MSIFDPVWGQNGTAEPLSEAEVALGFECGPVSPYEFNWIIQQLQSAINALGISNAVEQSREIETTEGIQGGGDLSANRLLRLHINGLPTESSIANDDLIAIYDQSAGVHRAMTRESFVAGLGGGGSGGGGGGGGGIEGATNIGGAAGELFSSVDGGDLEFRTVAAGAGLSVSVVGDTVLVAHADYVSQLTVD